MNTTLAYLPRSFSIASLVVSVFVTSHIQAGDPIPPTQSPLSYTVTDLGTLGGSNSIAAAPSGQSSSIPLARIVVGSTNVSDGSEHAFIWVKGQMYDLNLLCDLSTSDFKVLTVAKTIDDCMDIVGEGIATDGNKHAFLLTPTLVDGGRWCYSCCQWIWKQEGGGWQWDTGSQSYTWHGGPGSHGNCPDHPPHCSWWPLPCPDGCGCDHDCLPPEWCYCCINGVIYIRPTADCQARGGQCFSCPQDAIKLCQPCHWCCLNGKVFPSNDEENCRKKGGQCFATEEEAIRNCKACWWCCLDGKIFQTTWNDCINKGGQCYPSEEEAKAHQKECTPCWVCINGKPVQVSQAEAKAKNLECYPTAEEAQKHCKCWCCLQTREGKRVVEMSEEECKRSGGVCYASREEADRDCGRPCWVCIDGKTVQMSQAEAKAKDLQCYPSPEEAQAHCKPCWCCFADRAGKHLVQTTEDDCKRRGGVCYDNPEEARKHGCVEKLCWVCIDGKPVQMSEEDAQKKDLHCYGSPQDAAAHCQPCWCCFVDRAGKHLVQTTEEDCKRRGGVCYNSPQEAQERGCVKLCWVCIDGRPVQIPEAEAFAKKLRCYPTEEAAKNSKDCAPAGGWCCVDTATGMSVVPSTAADCEKNGGKWYASEQEARKACEISDCWCCIYNTEMRKMTVVHTTTADCQAKGGRCFASEQEAKACGGTPPPLCWVCIDRNVQQLSAAEAQARKLQCFNSREEAQRGCGGEGTWWCCVNGKVVQVPEAQAQARMASTQCYRTREEAVRACEGPKIWCCIDGQVVQSTEAECRARNGQAYRSEKEARARCGGGAKCWTCVNGKVVQLTQAQAQGRGLPCFGSREEATRNCQGGGDNKKCWVCINGRVGQVPESVARGRGLQCFSSREEAQRSCGERQTPQQSGRRR